MIQRSNSAYTSVRTSTLLLMLGVCVFLWGFSYKLSLYDVHQRSLHTVPDAKLLSKNEDSCAADGVQHVLSATGSEQSTVLLQAVAMTIAIADAETQRRYFNESNGEDLKPRIAIETPSLYFRPPPVQALL